MLSIHFSTDKTHLTQTFDRKSNSFFPLPIFQAITKPLISGYITVQPLEDKSVQPLSLKVQVIGLIENHHDESIKILCDKIQLLGEVLIQKEEKDYEFNIKLEEMYQTLKGTNFEMKYLLRASLYGDKGVIILAETEREFGVQRLRDDQRRIEKFSIDLHLEDIFGYLFEMNKTEYYTDDIVVAKISILKALIWVDSIDLKILKIEHFPVKEEKDPERYEECICKHKVQAENFKKGDIFGIKINLSHYNLATSASFRDSGYSIKYHFRVTVTMMERFFFKNFCIKLWDRKVLDASEI